MASLPRSARRQLDHEGYLVLRGLLDRALVDRATAALEALWSAEGDAAGSENVQEPGARRLANLATKNDLFRVMATDPRILPWVGHVLGAEFHLTMLNARDVPAGARPRMPFHCDTDYAVSVDTTGYYTCTLTWMLDPFTRASGATRYVPGSHRLRRLPAEAMDDLCAPHPDEVVIEGQPGDVIVMNGHGWHAGAANRTTSPRRGVFAFFMRAGVPRRTRYRQVFAEEIVATLTPRERRILAIDT